MSRVRKLLTLTKKEQECAYALLGLLAIAAPCGYRSLRFITKQLDGAAATVLAVVAAVMAGTCGYMLWERRTSCTGASLGVALIWTGALWGFLGALIAVSGCSIASRFVCHPEPRTDSIPLLLGALVALSIGAVISKMSRRGVQSPHNRRSGP